MSKEVLRHDNAGMSPLKNMSHSSALHTWSLQGETMLPCVNGVPLSDRGFRYGQHLFETVAAREGKYLFATEHIDRLVKAAERCGFPFSRTAAKALHSFCKTKPPGDGLLRIILTAGDGAPGTSIKAPRLFAFWEEGTFLSQEEIAQGVTLVSLEEPVGTVHWGKKTGNYWDHLSALETARAAGAEEGLIFDASGHVISATMANLIVWFDNGIVVTPPQARGARDGVMLHWACQHLPEITEGDISRSDLRQARAMALTNSRIGIMPVVSLDGMKLAECASIITLTEILYSSKTFF